MRRVVSPSRRYEGIRARTDDLGKTEQLWFKGFAALADSIVISAVEQVAQGVATFSSNPLIADALVTFAGTVARKATQNIFLEVDL